MVLQIVVLVFGSGLGNHSRLVVKAITCLGCSGLVTHTAAEDICFFLGFFLSLVNEMQIHSVKDLG